MNVLFFDGLCVTGGEEEVQSERERNKGKNSKCGQHEISFRKCRMHSPDG